ncbi:MAG: Txe/YoeB family addiction module toxin [Bacteroidales bacterium]|nr:Txe/YoeB family addiction module toxin [Bacteroidales bacterium]
MSYKIDYTHAAKVDLASLKRSNPIGFRKARKLLEELMEHPRMGTGHPERLKYFGDTETWSRTINDKDRLVYEIHDEVVTVLVLSALGHYGDK